MILPILCLPVVSFAIAWIATWIVRRVALRVGFVDKPGGRKIHPNAKPLGGGIAIFLAVALPLLAVIIVAHTGWVGRFWHGDPGYPGGARQDTTVGVGLIGAMLAMHLLGLCDDRKAMGPYSKLFLQLAIIAVFVAGFDIRALTALDHYGLGRWPSVVVTVLWIGAITNAFNFLDNMDGLSAGVAAVCATAFLFAALSIGQTFVATMLAMLIGALLGFLCFNFAPATIFMGDSGSLLIGLLLGVLTVRTTFLDPGTTWAKGWYAVFAPVVVLAVPLYDLIVVSFLRMLRGKSPFVGDTNHFSHRLVSRGMSRRTAVLCLYLVTASTSIAAILLPHVSATYAPLLFLQTVLILCVIALLEQHPLPMGKPDGQPGQLPSHIADSKA